MVVKLSFSEISGNAKLTAISVIRTGSADDADVHRVHIFLDADQNGEPDGQAISSSSFSRGLATLSGLNNHGLSPSTDWIICFEIESNADATHTAGLIIQSNGITGSGGTVVHFTGFVGNDSPLPVSLINFSVIPFKQSVRLLWRTESEIENYYWIIERKTVTGNEYEMIMDGKMIIEDTSRPFYFIGRVEGQGTVNMRTDYQFVDETIRREEYYAYRLADVSFNGKVTYHDAVLLVPEALPQEYELSQNYPNPFNPETKITYSLTQDSHVTIRIFNILGQEVIELVNENRSAGIHDIIWNGLNQSRHRVASGTYICIMRAESLDRRQQFTKSHKMTLIR